jgi:hypothetical protein
MRLQVAIASVDRVLRISRKQHSEISSVIFVSLPLIRLPEKWKRGQNQQPEA